MKFDLAEESIFFELRNWETSQVDRPILFLHSALSTHKEFNKLSSFYQNRKQILLDFPSQGQSDTIHKNLTSTILAENVRSLLEHLNIYSVDIIGYSLGGYVALELSRIAPSMVHSIVSHAMKFYWTDGAISESLVQLDIQKLKARSQRGFEILSEMHSTNGLEMAIDTMRSVIQHFEEEQLREADILKILSPLLLSVGDRDELVSLQEITKLYQSQASKKTFLAIHPNSPHSISKLDIGSFTFAVRRFWNLYWE